MNDRLRIAMAQLNLLVGDVRGNTLAIIDAACRARDELRAQVVICPELALTGYPPDDLLLRDDFLGEVSEAIAQLCRAVRGVALIVGAPVRSATGLMNAALVIEQGRIVASYAKHHLPTYGVFDDTRYFEPGRTPCVVEVEGCHIGVTICEDAWHPGPVAWAVQMGAEVVVNLNASPFDQYKWAAREAVIRERIGETGVAMLYCNMAGGQDEVVYDGASCAFGRHGDLRVRAPRFCPGLVPVDLIHLEGGWEVLEGPIEEDPSEEAVLYDALVWGVRDYVEKNGFPGVIVGLSGGIDSALVACMAVDALDAERVETVMMPTQYTSEISQIDAAALAGGLGVRHRVIAIEGIFKAFLEALQPAFVGMPADVTEENLQSRIRGTLLMALSNKQGKLVLTTGNKSELAVGYATLYGDMVGGFAPLKDIFKTDVYSLARYRNELGEVIPQRILARPPSAELRPNQLDTDSLPEYTVLDRILAAYVEEDRSVEEIVADGYDRATVEKVVRLVQGNEYKRRQAPPGVKVTTKAFGRERRY
ncbi:MAG: NAD+ synthase, partial [Nitrococcus mobilis]|nr:NAD+ synthase [Nitrococcus mobilis]